LTAAPASSTLAAVSDPVRSHVASSDGTQLATYRWDPAGAPKAIAQITHGVGEHAMRYARVAQALTADGWVVYAHDHRGHGASSSPEWFGVLGDDGWELLVADIGLVGRHARGEHPDLSLSLVAHSLGSFATQQFLLDHSADLDAVVLSGTAAMDLLEPNMDLDAMDLSAFNAPFAPSRTDFDWLTRDEAEVDAYIADPWCGFGLDVPGWRGMFDGVRALADPERVAGVRDDLPVYVVVGADDPVGAGLTLVQPVVDRVLAAGLTDVTLRVYPGARHEVFNETNRAEVLTDLVAWLDAHLSG
jgi:alpha-beta hydrolase superfamily lysophospholipase